MSIGCVKEKPIPGIEHHEGVGLVEAHRVEAKFVGAGAGDDGFDFRYLRQDGALYGAVDGDGLVDADGGQFFKLHDQVALIHCRHEALAEQHEGASGGGQCNGCTQHVGTAVTEG